MSQKLYSIQFAVIILLIANLLYGQEETDNGLQLLKESYARLDKMDYRPLRTNYLLNKGFFFGQDLDIYKTYTKGENEREEENMVFSSPKTFARHMRGLKRSEHRGDFLLNEERLNAHISTADEDKNEVPIGIISVQGEWLEGYEIDENVRAKQENRLISKIYQKTRIVSASVLVSQVATPQVSFIIDNNLYFDEERSILGLEMDFGDGEGYREVAPGDRLYIDYGYPGEKAISIKIETPKGVFYNYSAIDVLSYEREEPDHVFDLSSSKSKNTKTLQGGRAELFLGCDNLFDKPVIVVEGFDPLNKNSIKFYLRDDIISKNTMEKWLNNYGYDLVYLNFNDGGDDIKDNSLVLQALLRDVNQLKVGNHDIVVIGVSMGGLVARHAIRQLEIGRYTHNISHYISYDSPHKGANVPVGLQTLLLDFDNITIRNAFNIAQSAIDEAKDMLNSKAARQMLLRYKGPNPHPDFVSFQNTLNSLGFPSQGGIKNIAIVNGSATGIQQSPVGNYAPGDKIVDVNWLSLPIQAFVSVWTNDINTVDKVSSILLNVSTIREKSFNFNNLNYDIAAGGISPTTTRNIALPAFLPYINMYEIFGSTLQTFGRDDFSFVPLFSSLASQESLTNQSKLNRSVSYLQSANLTPFDAVYAGNSNTRHVITMDIISQWQSLLSTELGVTPHTYSCQVGTGGSMGTAPPPYITGDRFLICEFDRDAKYWDADQAAFNGLFQYQWNLTRGSMTHPGGTHNQYTITSAISPGAYTLSATRSYVSPINGTTSASHSRVINVYPASHPTYGCTSKSRSADSDISELNADLDNHLRVYPNPNPDGVISVAYDIVEEGEITLSIHDINGKESIRLTNGIRKAGAYTERYDLSTLSSGIYIVRLSTAEDVTVSKVLISER